MRQQLKVALQGRSFGHFGNFLFETRRVVTVSNAHVGCPVAERSAKQKRKHKQIRIVHLNLAPARRGPAATTRSRAQHSPEMSRRIERCIDACWRTASCCAGREFQKNTNDVEAGKASLNFTLKS